MTAMCTIVNTSNCDGELVTLEFTDEGGDPCAVVLAPGSQLQFAKNRYDITGISFQDKDDVKPFRCENNGRQMIPQLDVTWRMI